MSASLSHRNVTMSLPPPPAPRPSLMSDSRRRRRRAARFSPHALHTLRSAAGVIVVSLQDRHLNAQMPNRRPIFCDLVDMRRMMVSVSRVFLPDAERTIVRQL